MAEDQVLARRAKLFINTGTKLTIVDRTSTPTGGPATWVAIEHIKTMQPSRSEQSQDTSDYDDAGEDSSIITSRGQTFAMSYRFFADETDGSRLPGQAAIEALADEIGAAGIGQFKYIPFPGAQVRVFNAHVGSQQGPGGGTQDIGMVNFTLTKTGQFYKGANV